MENYVRTYAIGVARNLRWGLTTEAPKASRRKGNGPPPHPTMGPGECRKLPQRGPPGRKRVLEYLTLEKTQLMATNLSYLAFLRHIFSHIHTHNYYT